MRTHLTRMAEGVTLPSRDLITRRPTLVRQSLRPRRARSPTHIARSFPPIVGMPADENFPAIHADRPRRRRPNQPRLIESALWARLIDPKSRWVGKGVCFDPRPRSHARERMRIIRMTWLSGHQVARLRPHDHVGGA